MQVKEQVLTVLEEQKGQTFSGAELAKKLGVSPECGLEGDTIPQSRGLPD